MTDLEQILGQERQSNDESLIEEVEKVKLVIVTIGADNPADDPDGTGAKTKDDWGKAAKIYAFYGQNISEILAPQTPVFFVPGCPSTLPGVINLRGEIESVIDIAAFLQFSQTSHPPTALIMAKAQLDDDKLMRSAIAVTRVIDVVDIDSNEIKAAPDNLPIHLQEYVLGALMFKQHVVTLLSIEKVLNDFRQRLQQHRLQQHRLQQHGEAGQ